MDYLSRKVCSGMIEVYEVGKRFGDRSAVRSVSFTAQDRAITGLLGVNGAGKSTTLRIISGVLTPSAGRVLIDNIPVLTDRVDAQAHLGALLDHTGLYPRLTARQNLAYFGRLRRIPTELLHQRIEQWITALGLGKIADHPTAGFSQGERMKVALGRVLLHSPANLLLDEPTNGLDILSVRNLRVLFCEMRDAGMCILFASHVLEEVTVLCDNILILSDGVIVASGSVNELCLKTGTRNLEGAFLAFTSPTEADRV
jgi:sodium transport system ATP-binding protein